jgi:hypothetical protein
MLELSLKHDDLAKRNTELKLKFNHKIYKVTTKSETKIPTLKNLGSNKKLKKETNQLEKHIGIS